MNATKAMTLLAAVAVGLSAQALTLAVKDVKIAQRYPWNGLVDIDYTVECDDKDADVYVYPVGYDADMNMSVALFTLTGDGANGKTVKAGTHRMTWDMSKDMGANYNRAKFSVKMHAYSGAAPYLVVDLSEGSNAEKYKVEYLSEMPGAAWPTEYKTTKLVLKLVTPGKFMMGSPVDEPNRDTGNSGNNERLHEVTITKPFYMGVFELTQKQYTLVMGSNPSSYTTGDPCPVEYVSYDMIRGTANGAKWPEHRQVDGDSFLGKLRARTGITFDLPTEAQWEYTCRAGTATMYNNGKNTGISDLARHSSNRNDGKGGYGLYTTVGSYQPNAWGFYDMLGNVSEWCIDRWGVMSESPATDPVGMDNGSDRVVRGGDWGYQAQHCRSAQRTLHIRNTNGKSFYVGFRVACIPAE